MPRRPPRQLAEPLEVPMMPFAVGGTALWAVAGLVLLASPYDVAAADRTMWLWTCLAGVVGGLLGVLFVHVRARGQRVPENRPQEPSRTDSISPSS